MNAVIYHKALDIVNNSTGIKLTELISNVASEYTREESKVLIDTLSALCDSDDVLVLKYTVPAMDYREKVILFPKGTKFL